jgi:hypothetical protein
MLYQLRRQKSHDLHLGLHISLANIDLTAKIRAAFVIWAHGGSFFVGKHYAPFVWLEPGLRARG